MEEKISIVLTNQQLEVVYRGLLELPSKYSLSVIQEIEKQIKEQEAKQNLTEKTSIKEKK
jgi:hypothetical protein